MFAILNKDIALRGWQLVPYGYYIKGIEDPKGLTKEEYEVCLLADAKHDIHRSKITDKLINNQIIFECKKNQYKLNSWQKRRFYDNRLMPKMNIQITGRCNFNCIHCFNAKDNNRLQSQFTYNEMIKLLDQARDCGIHAITITGGEPLVHKDIKKILKAIVDRDMFINEINTNGFLLKQTFLDYLIKLKQHPLIKISYDGIKYHDIMRGFKGAEKDAIRAIKLCMNNGFRVMAQVNVNKNNIKYMPETLEYLDKLKLDTIRFIRTTEVPRWLKNAGKCLTVKEYYDAMLKLCKQYVAKPRNSKIIIWQFIRLYPLNKTYSMEPISSIRNSQPICKGARGMIAIGASGNVYPCMQMSGGYDFAKIKLGNVKENKLKDILQSDTKYMKTICTTVEQKAKFNKICKKCKYYIYCGTGCPALSASKSLINKTKFTLMNPDEWKCLFFKYRYDLKIENELKGYKNASLMVQ